MNHIQYSELHFDLVIERYGAPQSVLSKGDLVVIVDADAKYLPYESDEISHKVSLVLASVRAVDSATSEVLISRLYRYYQDGTGCHEEGDKTLAIQHFNQSVEERIEDIKELFQNDNIE